MNQHSCNLITPILLLSMIVPTAIDAQEVCAQEIVAPNLAVQEAIVRSAVTRPVSRFPARVRWSIYDPFYAVTSRIYAQAEMIRAQGDAAVDFAYARNLHADAYSKELDNWKKELRVYWDRKTLAEQKKLELDHVRHIAKMKYLNDQQWQNHQLWDRLKNHPELSDSSIRSGRALNFVLARLASSDLPYRFDPETSRFSPSALAQLDLDEDLLRRITLKQGAVKFSAGQKADDSIRLWPYLLRWDEFESSRQAFEQARSMIARESQERGRVSVDRLRSAQTTLLKLSNDFHSSQDVSRWVKQNRRYTHFYAADRFLQELDREMIQLEKTGDMRPMGDHVGYDPQTDGNHLVSLLSFMNRNGVEFAAASPGNEFAYHNLFVLMRSLYLTTADEDASQRPENLGELAK